MHFWIRLGATVLRPEDRSCSTQLRSAGATQLGLLSIKTNSNICWFSKSIKTEWNRISTSNFNIFHTANGMAIWSSQLHFVSPNCPLHSSPHLSPNMPGVKEAPRAVWKWYGKSCEREITGAPHWRIFFRSGAVSFWPWDIDIFRCPCRTLSDCRGLWRREVDTVLTATELLDLLREAGEGCCGGCGKSACEERALAWPVTPLTQRRWETCLMSLAWDAWRWTRSFSLSWGNENNTKGLRGVEP